MIAYSIFLLGDKLSLMRSYEVLQNIANSVSIFVKWIITISYVKRQSVFSFILKSCLYVTPFIIILVILLSQFLTKILRRPANQYLGLDFEEIRIKSFRKFSVTGIYIHASKSSFARRLISLILPSADVSTDSIRDVLNGCLERDPSFCSFRGSSISIRKIQLRLSLQVFFFHPYSQPNTKAYHQDVNESPRKSEKEKHVPDESDLHYDKSGFVEKIKHLWNDVKHILSFWVKKTFFPYFLPIVKVEVLGLCFEIDKAYLAPHTHSSISIGGNGSDLHDDASINLPAALLPSNIRKPENDTEMCHNNLPTFDQENVINAVSETDINAANNMTFYVEKWVKSTRKNFFDKKQINKNRKSLFPTFSSNNVEEDNEEEKNDKQNNDQVKKKFRRIFNYMKIRLEDPVIIISGVDKETVISVRKKLPPHVASLYLAKVPISERAYVGITMKSASLKQKKNTNNLQLKFSGVSFHIGSPIKEKIHVSNGSLEEKMSNKKDPKIFNEKSRCIREHIPKKESEKCNWHELFVFDLLLEVTGSDKIAVWSANYDHMWDSRHIGFDINVSYIQINMASKPIHQLMIILDDYFDPNSPANEWKSWLTQCIKENHLTSEQLLQTYRQSYVSEKSAKKKISPSKNSQINQNTKNKASSSKESIPNEISSLALIEKQMSFADIMKQRSMAMKDEWKFSPSNEEFLSFLQSTYASVSSIYYQNDNDNDHGDDYDYENSILPSSLHGKTFRSDFEALISFLTMKFSFFAPQISSRIKIGNIYLTFSQDTIIVSDIVELKNDTIEESLRELFCSTTLEVAGVSIDFSKKSLASTLLSPKGSYPQSPKFESEVPKSREVYNVQTRIDNISLSPTSFDPNHQNCERKTIPQNDHMGLLYKLPLDSLRPMIEFNLSKSLDSTTREGPKFSLNAEINDPLFVFNPLPLLYILENIMELSGIPYRDLLFEKGIPKHYGRITSSTKIRSIEETTMQVMYPDIKNDFKKEGSEMTVSLQDATNSSENPCLLFLRSNISFNISFSNSSLLIVTKPHVYYQSVISLKVTDANVRLTSSSIDESISMSSNEVTVSCSSLSGKGMKKDVEDLPLEHFLDIEKIETNYHGSHQKNNQHNCTNIKYAGKIGELSGIDIIPVDIFLNVEKCRMYESCILHSMLLGCTETYLCFSDGLERIIKTHKSNIQIPPNSSHEICKILGIGEDRFQNLLDQMDRSRDDLVSDDDLNNIVNRVSSDVFNIPCTNLPVVSKMTKIEMDRELRHIKTVLSCTNTQLTYLELEAYINILAKCNSENIDVAPPDSDAPWTRTPEFLSTAWLNQLVYYQDYREYSSWDKVYDITGSPPSSEFPLPIEWSQGRGIQKFWNLYKTETGCSPTSLEGNDMIRVQRKLVRALRNYKFAEFAWTTMVRPNLRQDRYLNTTLDEHGSDWLLYGDLCTIDTRSSTLQRLARDVYSIEKDTKAKSIITKEVSKKKHRYDVHVSMKFNEITLCFGLGLRCNGNTLLKIELHNTEIQSDVIVQPPSQGDLFVPLSLNPSSHDSPLDDSTAYEETGNVFYFETTISASYLRTKHNTMEVFVEPYEVYCNCNFVPIQAPSKSFENDLDEISMSIRLHCPRFLNFNFSPSLLETFEQVEKIFFSSFSSQKSILTTEILISLTNSLNNTGGKRNLPQTSFIFHDYLLKLQETFFDQSSSEIQKLEQAWIDDLEIDEYGYVTYDSVKRSTTENLIPYMLSRVNPRRQIGVFLSNLAAEGMSVCKREEFITSRDSMLRLTRNSILLSFKTIPMFTFKAFEIDLQNNFPRFLLSIPGYKIIEDIPFSPTQSLILRLKSLRKKRPSSDRRYKYVTHDSASQFQPCITLVPKQFFHDATVIEVRTNISIETQTPVDIRIVKIEHSFFQDLKAKTRKNSYLPKQDMDQFLDMIVQNASIVNDFYNLVEGGLIHLPLSIISSSYHHALLIRDISEENPQPWRTPVLLTKAFLQNKNNLPEISKCHAMSNIIVRLNRLNVHRSEKQRKKSIDPRTKKTGWDMSIFVLPSFTLCNALPFPILLRCWQTPDEQEDYSEEGGEIIDNDIEHVYHRQSILQERNKFVCFNQLNEGDSLRVNGVNMNQDLLVQLSHDCSQICDVNETTIKELGWSAPLQVQLSKLRLRGRSAGQFSLPLVTSSLGDDFQFCIDMSMDKTDIPCCTIYAQYWLINKSCLKLQIQYQGQDETIIDSGAGGLPITFCRKESDKRHVSFLPLERCSEKEIELWWDTDTNGKLVLSDPLLISNGKRRVKWSDKIDLNAVGTDGEVKCKDVLFGYTVSSLTGTYHKTNVLTVFPRYIVKNTLHIPIKILPVYGTFAKAQKLGRSFSNMKGNVVNDNHLMAKTISMTSGESTVLLCFHQLEKELQDMKRHHFMLVRIEAQRFNYFGKWHLIKLESLGVEYLTERNGIYDYLSGLVLAENFFKDGSIICNLSHSENYPLKIENRSCSQFIQFMQDDTGCVVIELPPMTSCGYSWDNNYGNKRIRAIVIEENQSNQHASESFVNKDWNVFHENQIEVASSSNKKDSRKPKGLAVNKPFPFSKHMDKLLGDKSRIYNPSKIGEHSPLPCYSFGGSTESKEKLFVHLSVEAGTRVISFSDSTFRSDSLNNGLQRMGGNWKDSEININLAGICFHVIDDFPHELMSITFTEFSIIKPQKTEEGVIRLRHFQIDAMSPEAKYPIILQPILVGVDRRQDVYFEQDHSAELSSFHGKNNYWMNNNEKPIPLLEILISFIPSKSMVWIPNFNLNICPVKAHIELIFILKVADMILDGFPTNKDSINSLIFLDEKLQYSSIACQNKTFCYIENFEISPTYVEIHLDMRHEGGATFDEFSEDQSFLVLNSLGRVSSSTLTASFVTWMSDVAAAFSQVSPTLKYRPFSLQRYYGDVYHIFNVISRIYVYSSIQQGYKLFLSMHVLGDPNDLYSKLMEGIGDLFTITKEEIKAGGKHGVGKGLQSFYQNVFGGVLMFTGKFTGTLADVIDSAASNEFTTNNLNRKQVSTTDAPDNFIQGVSLGSIFLAKTLVHGIAGVIGNPYRGMKTNSLHGFARGTVSGFTGFAVAPFVGALGFIAKSSAGFGTTAGMFEIGVIESRCRPRRIVNWGTSVGFTGIPYLKAIGIRVHFLRYQTRYRQSEGSKLDTVSKKSHNGTKDKITNPSKMFLSIMRLRDRQHYLSDSKRPLLCSFSDNSRNSSKIANYILPFEQTIVIRGTDIQLSDQLVIQLYKSSFLQKKRGKSISKCYVSVGDIYTFMNKFYQEQLRNQTTAIKQAYHKRFDLNIARDKHVSQAMPCLQEFAMMRSLKPERKTRKNQGTDVLRKISDEMFSIEEENRKEMEYMESSSISSESDDSFDVTNGKKMQSTDGKVKAGRFEQLHGHISMSFFPIPW